VGGEGYKWPAFAPSLVRADAAGPASGLGLPVLVPRSLLSFLRVLLLSQALSTHLLDGHQFPDGRSGPTRQPAPNFTPSSTLCSVALSSGVAVQLAHFTPLAAHMRG